MSDEQDRPTSVICGLCRGSRLRPIVLEKPDGGYASTFRACWLCNGVGSVTPAVLCMWIASGRPEKKEDM